MRWRAVAALIGLMTLLVACGGGGGTDSAATKRRSTTATSTTAIPPSTAVPATETPTAAPTTSAAQSTGGGNPAPAPASPVDQLIGVENAQQVIAVVADGYGQTTATLTAYEKDGATWRTVFGPMTASVGGSGFAPPDAKREGDGRTPSGSYGFDFLFGVDANPGVKFPYRDITGTSIVWDDDSASARYNLWSDTSTQDAGVDPEPMYNRPAYNYGAVTAYNAARTPGLGSAIFLHVSTGGPTAGCVSIPQGALVEVLRWLDPARQPRIIMGPRSVIMP